MILPPGSSPWMQWAARRRAALLDACDRARRHELLPSIAPLDHSMLPSKLAPRAGTASSFGSRMGEIDVACMVDFTGIRAPLFCKGHRGRIFRMSTPLGPFGVGTVGGDSSLVDPNFGVGLTPESPWLD